MGHSALLDSRCPGKVGAAWQSYSAFVYNPYTTCSGLPHCALHSSTVYIMFGDVLRRPSCLEIGTGQFCEVLNCVGLRQ